MLRMFRQVFFLILLSIIFVTVGTSQSFAYSGTGSGTSGDPYEISTCAQFQEMNGNLSAYYQQNNDIDCTGVSFSPIGTTDNAFTGTFDGKNFAINNITITSNASTVGVFGNTNGATIRNVRLVNGTVTGNGASATVGTLIGINSANTTVLHASSNLTLVTSGSQYVGGLIGWSNASMTIQKSFYSGTIQSNSSAAVVGGLVSGVSGSGNSISDSYTSGTIAGSGNGYKGALVALVYSQITITNSYTSASITFSGTGYGGGLVGGLFAGSVTHSFSAATIAGSTSFLRAMYGTGTITNTGNYFDIYLAGTGTTGCSSECTAVNTSNNTPNYFKNNSTNAPLTSWDFTNTWQTVSGDYPALRGFSSPAPIPTQTPTPTPQRANTPSGSASSPSCTVAPPSTAPQLFQVVAKGTTATLYFVPVSGPNNKYFISYGLTESAEGFGTEFSYADSSGVIPYTVNSLFQGTWYFKVRGGNGCMPGSWSQIISTKVTGVLGARDNAVGHTTILGASTRNTPTCSEYTVQSGDSLWKIASSKLGSGTKYQTIMQKNSLTSSRLTVGQKLMIGCS